MVSIIDDPEAVPPSKQYTFYSDQITRVMSEMGTETEARQFVLDTYVLSQTNSVPAVASYYPALREFVKHYRKTPELLIVLYSLSTDVAETQGAGEWLRQANEIDPRNEYVLWQRLLSRGVPWFPRELVHSADLFEDEKWLLDELLKHNPFDPLALGVQAHLMKTQRPLITNENIQFLNSLHRLAPHPMTHMSLVFMLEGPKPSRTHTSPVQLREQ